MNVRSLLKHARDFTFRAVENVWAFGFGVWGKFARPRARILDFVGGQRVCVIAPHPDDEVVGCGGALVLHRRAGDAVRVVYVTDGRKSRALGLEENEMARRRGLEADATAKILGVEKIWYGLPEGAWEVDGLARKLAQLWRDDVDILYAPSRVDLHPEHWRVAHAIALALKQVPQPPRVRVYAIQVPLTPRLGNSIAVVRSARAQIERALDAYATQRGSTWRARRMRHYAARCYGANGWAEEFWEMDAAQFVRLHESPPREWANAFRSVRMSPFTDTLAYFYGRAERARLKQWLDA